MLIKTINILRGLGYTINSVTKKRVDLSLDDHHFLIEPFSTFSNTKYKLFFEGHYVLSGTLNDITEYLYQIKNTKMFPNVKDFERQLYQLEVPNGTFTGNCRFLSLVERTKITKFKINKKHTRAGAGTHAPTIHVSIREITKERADLLSNIIDLTNDSIGEIFKEQIQSIDPINLLHIVYLGDNDGDPLICLIRHLTFESKDELVESIPAIQDVIEILPLDTDNTLVYWVYPKDFNINLSDYISIFEDADCIITKIKV